jgi:hypothetical protein
MRLSQLSYYTINRTLITDDKLEIVQKEAVLASFTAPVLSQHLRVASGENNRSLRENSWPPGPRSNMVLLNMGLKAAMINITQRSSAWL